MGGGFGPRAYLPASHGRLMLTVLGGPAEFERELTRSRTGEGRERAKAKGVRFGSKPIDSPSASGSPCKRVAGEVLVDIARSYNLSTFDDQQALITKRIIAGKRRRR